MPLTTACWTNMSRWTHYGLLPKRAADGSSAKRRLSAVDRFSRANEAGEGFFDRVSDVAQKCPWVERLVPSGDACPNGNERARHLRYATKDAYAGKVAERGKKRNRETKDWES